MYFLPLNGIRQKVHLLMQHQQDQHQLHLRLVQFLKCIENNKRETSQIIKKYQIHIIKIQIY